MVCHEWEENQHYCCRMCECWWHLHSTYGDLECEDDAFWYGSWRSPWYLTRILWQWMDRSRIAWHLVPQFILAVCTFSPSTTSLNWWTQHTLLPWNHPSSCKTEGDSVYPTPKHHPLKPTSGQKCFWPVENSLLSTLPGVYGKESWESCQPILILLCVQQGMECYSHNGQYPVGIWNDRDLPTGQKQGHAIWIPWR